MGWTSILMGTRTRSRSKVSGSACDYRGLYGRQEDHAGHGYGRLTDWCNVVVVSSGLYSFFSRLAMRSCRHCKFVTLWFTTAMFVTLPALTASTWSSSTTHSGGGTYVSLTPTNITSESISICASHCSIPSPCRALERKIQLIPDCTFGGAPASSSSTSYGRARRRVPGLELGTAAMV